MVCKGVRVLACVSKLDRRFRVGDWNFTLDGKALRLQYVGLSMLRCCYLIGGWRPASGAQGREKYLGLVTVAGVGKALGGMKSSREGF